MAGYSRRSLVEKLGIKADAAIAILGAPTGYARTLGPLPKGVIRRATAAGSLDFVHFFAREERELKRAFRALERALTPAGALWISWPISPRTGCVRSGSRTASWTSRWPRWTMSGRGSSSCGV
jgi:hypothetical protein